jgi:hypothetical protein
MNEMSNCVMCDESVIREEHSREEVKDGLKLDIETRMTDDGVTIVFCTGRIVYRDEAAALAKTILRLITDGRNLVLDLSGVEMVDGAGLGELVLAPVFDIYSSVEAAAASYQLSAIR